VARCESSKRAAPNFTKLVQLERTASAVVRACAEGAAVCLQLCAAGEGRTSVEDARREVVGTWYLTTFSPGASSR